MNTEHLTSLAALALAGSLAMERMVTIIKSLFPSLTEERVPRAGQSVARVDQRRRLSVLAITMLASSTTALVIADGSCPMACGVALASGKVLPWWLYALLISGGSAFWTSIVAYASAIKDMRSQERQDLQRSAAARADLAPPTWTTTVVARRVSEL